MKSLISFLALVMLTTSGCVNDAAVKPADDAKQQHARHHSAEAKGVCADTKALPSNQCAETISAAFDGKGVLWITWASNDHVYVQSSNDKGLSFTAPVMVNPVAEKIEAKGEYRPKIKPDAKGNIYLSWTLKLEGRHSGHIRFSRSTDGGRHFSAPVTVNDNLDVISHRFDSMAIGKNGEIFIAWLDARDVEEAKKAGKQFEGSSLYYSWSDDGGQHFYPNKRIATHTCQCCRLDTAIAPDNTPVITWRHVFEGGIRDHALIKFNDWNTPGDTHRLGQDNWKIDACPHHGPGLSISDSGIYHAVWFSGSPTNPGLFYAYSTDAGRHFSTPVNFGKEGAGHPHVLALGSQVRVVWQEFDGTHNVIKLIKSIDDGKSWSKPEVIAQTAQSGDQPFLVSDGQKIYLSWKTQQQDYQLKPIE
ncbi:MAG: sialidase family protein [Methylobacter sp.]|uniref:sialidase family protein n=1 Tax=Methylobacter sp. TaxID=2051955 RepID=UPI002730607B|nr:sialidase family protein [Methylobacter sp.]MDP1664356.1 sialidase family protein [Methylobacter sp.]